MDGQGVFKGDAATERVLRDVVLPGLEGLLATLPAAPGDGTDAQVWAHAHGFFCRAARTCQAILALVDAGRGAESAPLRRAALEHALALAWVIDEGEAAIAALARAHQNRMRSIRDLLDDRWDVKAAEFERLLGFEVESQGQDHLVGFGNLVKRYDLSEDLLIAWLTDTGESHPSYLTARAYWHDGGTRLGTEGEDRPGTDVHGLAFVWWLAACQMDRLVGWGERLSEIGRPAGLPVVLLKRGPGDDSVPSS